VEYKGSQGRHWRTCHSLTLIVSPERRRHAKCQERQDARHSECGAYAMRIRIGSHPDPSVRNQHSAGDQPSSLIELVPKSYQRGYIMEITTAAYNDEAQAWRDRYRISFLLADHQAIVRKGLRALFDARPEWKIVGEASNGREAVENVRMLKPNLVITDIYTPELNGLDAVPRMLKVSPTTRILIFSMHNEEELIKMALKAGASAYLLKSDAEQTLLKGIETVLNGRMFVSPSLAADVLGHTQSRRRANSGGPNFAALTQREREVVQLLSEGCSNKQVADRLSISVRTAENHRARSMKKLGVGLCGLVRYAVRNNIIQA
jgi:DNA-binding NarL/FixJ family response regulator